MFAVDQYKVCVHTYFPMFWSYFLYTAHYNLIMRAPDCTETLLYQCMFIILSCFPFKVKPFIYMSNKIILSAKCFVLMHSWPTASIIMQKQIPVLQPFTPGYIGWMKMVLVYTLPALLRWVTQHIACQQDIVRRMNESAVLYKSSLIDTAFRDSLCLVDPPCFISYP